MNSLLIATPLPIDHESSSQPLHDDISIQKMNNINWEEPLFRWACNESNLERLKQTRHWMCCADRPRNFPGELLDSPVSKLKDAILSLQILVPCGTLNTLLQLTSSDQEYNPAGILQDPIYHDSLLGRSFAASKTWDLKNFMLLYSMVHTVFSPGVKPYPSLRDSLQLFRHGMQMQAPALRLLMFTMGLDALMMGAGTKLTFSRRLKHLLGADSPVFGGLHVLYGQPHLDDSWMSCDNLSRHAPSTRPINEDDLKVTVSGVVDHLYDARSRIAHGNSCSKAMSTDTRPLTIGTSENECYTYNTNGVEWSHLAFLSDCALFLLRQILYDIATSGSIDIFQEGKTKQWRDRLEPK
jgi:hypothetical protein